MWPLDLPAQKVLKPPGETPVPWAVFQAGWYRRTYPDATDDAGSRQPADLLQHYLMRGQRQGHSPNHLFDETWHRQRYPQIARLIEAGEFASAFDAYCRHGCLDRSPHWLFDELLYRDRYPDLTLEVLREAGLFNGYDHYLRSGSQEDRIGHPLFDPVVYLANFAPADIPAIRDTGVFRHYLERGERGEPELRTSIYFDPDWYLGRYPQVADAVRNRLWSSALHHYLCNTTPTLFDPLEDFSEAYYLGRDPGLQQAIEAGEFRSGYMHFLLHGARELRSPAATINLAWYAEQHPVRRDLERKVIPEPFTHWLTAGKHQGLQCGSAPMAHRKADRAQPTFNPSASSLLPILGRFGYSFECHGTPAVSVVLPVRDGFALTMATVASLRANFTGNIELIIIDCGSTDEIRMISDYVRGARLLRLETDIGFVQAANAGSQLASAAAILFLAGGTQLGSGAVEHALNRLNGDPSFGAVGGMVIQPDGAIAQAGGILWNDGSTHDYQRGKPSLAPEANFVRSVDFCSAAFLLIRTEVFAQLEGFDSTCAASGYETVELCQRIIHAGFQVVYDPSVTVFRQDNDPEACAAGQHFLMRHAKALSHHFPPADAIEVYARHGRPSASRLLFIEDTVPLRRIGSGFVRSNDIVRTLADLGWQVTVFPVNGCRHNPARVYGDMPETVEVMHDIDIGGFKAFLSARAGYYDLLWIARTHNLDRVLPILAEVTKESGRRCPIILDTEAVVPLREAEVARLRQEPFDLDSRMQAAFQNVPVCDAIVAVNEAEAAILRDRGLAPVSVVSHMIEPRPTARPYEQRSGLLFVGAIHVDDSPNLDSLSWFAKEVLPLIERQLGWETRLTVAGYTAPGIDIGRLEQHPRITLRGAVANLAPLYDSHKVFIAPTRFAAGTPYKVFEAASFGVPVVATELLRSQLGWVDQEDILAASCDDPEAFAKAVVAAYRQENLWQTVRSGALRRIAAENSKDSFIAAIATLLAPHDKAGKHLPGSC